MDIKFRTSVGLAAFVVAFTIAGAVVARFASSDEQAIFIVSILCVVGGLAALAQGEAH